MEFHENPAEIKRILKERGMKFREYYTRKKGQQMFNYDGEVLCEDTAGRNLGFGDTSFERFFMSLIMIGTKMGNKDGDGNSKERVRLPPQH
jgi:hypothetical protein